MAYRRYSQEDIDRILREIEQDRANGVRLLTACNRASITDSTYYLWRKRKQASDLAERGNDPQSGNG